MDDYGGLVLGNGYAPGEPWHGGTFSVGPHETADQAIDRLVARFTGKACPRCGHGVRVNGIYHVCAAGCGWRRLVG